MSARNIFGNSFTVNQEINIVGKKTELKSKGENWPNLTLGEVATPTNISAMILAALGAIPTCSGSGRISQELMAVMGAVSTAGTVMVTQNQNTGQYTAEYILSLMKVMNGAYAKGGNLSEKELKRLIMLIMGQMLEKAGPGFSNWNQVLKDLMQNATLDNFMKGVQSAVCALTGDPVNANTGNFIYEKDDIEIKALVPIMFKRTYNRIDNREGCMGRGWRHNYEIELITEDDCYIIVWEDGREEIYMRLEDCGIDALFGCICRLEKKDKGFSYKTQQGIVAGTCSFGKIPNVNILSCNTGHLDHENNVASEFLSTQDINEVYSWDGSIVYNKMMGIRDLGLGEYVPALAMSQSYFESWIKGDGKKRKPIGKVVYHFNKSGQIEVRSASPGDRIGVNYPISCESQN